MKLVTDCRMGSTPLIGDPRAIEALLACVRRQCTDANPCDIHANDRKAEA